MRTLPRSIAPLAAAAVFLLPAVASAHEGGAVYTQTNSPAGNAVQILDRGFDGRLALAGSVPTGGAGTGAGLGSQGAVALSEDEQLLFAVDAGSDDVAAFRVRRGGLEPAGRVPSGGSQPVSIAVRDRSVYVLNAGGAPNVATFRIGRRDGLEPRPGGVQPLAAGAAGAAEVAVSPDGRALVVTERLANRLETLPLFSGRPGKPVITPSSGAVPFGFAFDNRGDIVVSEAAASTVSSYRLSFDGLRLISASVPTLQGAACWVAVTPDGRYAYTGNAATDSISGFAIGHDGSLRLLPADGRSASSPRPNDLAVADGYLYAVNPSVGQVTAYRLRADGGLEPLEGASGLPAGLAGLAAR